MLPSNHSLYWPLKCNFAGVLVRSGRGPPGFGLQEYFGGRRKSPSHHRLWDVSPNGRHLCAEEQGACSFQMDGAGVCHCPRVHVCLGRLVVRHCAVGDRHSWWVWFWGSWFGSNCFQAYRGRRRTVISPTPPTIPLE